MSFQVDTDVHRRRLGRNLGLGLLLAGFVVLMFALTIVKVGQGDLPHAKDAKKNTGVFVDPNAAQTKGSQP